jgi:hypothetical protein
MGVIFGRFALVEQWLASASWVSGFGRAPGKFELASATYDDNVGLYDPLYPLISFSDNMPSAVSLALCPTLRANE